MSYPDLPSNAELIRLTRMRQTMIDDRRPPRGYSIFEIQRKIAEAQSKLSDVQRALQPPLSRALQIERTIEYMMNNPLCANWDLYVDLRWQLAKARMHEDLDRIIMKHRYARAIETGAMDAGVDMARPGADKTSAAMWDHYKRRYGRMKLE
jgi:hypothetical protein